MTIPILLNNLLVEQRLCQVLLPGYLVTDELPGIKKLRPMFISIYLQFDTKFLYCQSIDQYDKLQFQVVDSIDCDFELEPNEEFAVAAVYDFLPISDERYFVEQVKLFLDDECDIEQGIVKGAAFYLENSEICLFLDPMNLTGIKLGDAQDMQRWLEIEGPFREFVWQRQDNLA